MTEITVQPALSFQSAGLSKELCQQLAKTQSYTGGTSLITMYIPSGYYLGLITKTLTSELSTASNIQSRTVRNSVISSLKSCMVAIKSSIWHNAPENGLVLLAGETKLCS